MIASPELLNYSTRFARTRGDSENPGLRDGVRGLWYPVLGPTGLQLFDQSSHGRDGTLTNMTVSDWNVSRFGYVLRFSGAGDRVLTSRNHDITGAAPRSCAVLFRSTYTADERAIFEIGVAATSQLWTLFCHPSLGGQRTVYVAVHGGNKQFGFDYADGQWHLVVFTLATDNVSGARCYADGVELAAHTTNPKAINTANSAIGIGNRIALNDALPADIAFAGLWRRALCFAEVRHLYRDLLAPLRRRRSFARTIAAIGGPYRAVAGDTFRTGAAAGEPFLSGPAAGQTFHTGQTTGQIHG